MVSYDIMKVIDLNSIKNDKRLIVKNFGNYKIIKYDKNQLYKENIKTLGLFRSVILDSNNNILSFAPPKSMYFDDFRNENDISSCYFQDFVEGTMINVFWDSEIDDWNIATRSNIGAKCRYNVTNKLTFRHMFLDAMNYTGLEFSFLNKNHIYSFVLQHPENRIVLPIINPAIYLAQIYKIKVENNKQFVEKIDLYEIKGVTSITNYTYDDIKENFGEDWEKLRLYFNNENLDYKNHGMVIYNNSGDRMKIRSKNYEKVKHLKGNTPKLQYHYYALRQSGQVRQFLEFYPEYKNDFRDLRNNLHKFTDNLYQFYIDCYIKKRQKVNKYPYNFKIHLYNLHQIYIQELMENKKFVSKQVVIDYVNKLHPAKLMYSVNHLFNKHKREEKIAESLSESK